MNPTGLEALRYLLDNGMDEHWVTTREGEAAVKVVRAMFLTPPPEEELREATMLLESVQERMYRFSPYSTLKAQIDRFLEKRSEPQGER
jgi:hypothetical protein